MLSSEYLKHIREQQKIDAILDIIKNESLQEKMVIISMVIDCIASRHNTSCLELWSLMFNSAIQVYKHCGVIAQHVKDIKLAYEKEVLNDKNNEPIF